MASKLICLYRKHDEIINYVIVGALTTLVSLVLFYGCTWTFLDASDAVQLQIANIISWIGSVAFAYVTNRIFVFKSKNKNLLCEAAAFVSSRLLTLALDMAVMFLLVTILKLNSDISKIMAQVLVIVGNYVISKLFVFKNK